MAETSGLLNRRTGDSRTEGSNPSVSARGLIALIRVRPENLAKLPFLRQRHARHVRSFRVGTLCKAALGVSKRWCGRDPDGVCQMNEEPADTRGKAIEWPSWATWALIAILLSSVATVAATLNDIW